MTTPTDQDRAKARELLTEYARSIDMSLYNSRPLENMIAKALAAAREDGRREAMREMEAVIRFQFIANPPSPETKHDE